MDPRDRLRAPLAGAVCTACGSTVDPRGIRPLARRDGLAFVELACDACGTPALGLVTDATDGDAEAGPATLDLAPYGEFGPLDEVRLARRAVISADDVLAMHAFLRDWRGDLRALVGDANPERVARVS